MNLNDFCRKVTDIGRYLAGITPANALSDFVGKTADPQTKAMRDREEEPAHYAYHGTKLADALAKIAREIKLYRDRVNHPNDNPPDVNDGIAAVYNRLVTTQRRMLIAHKLALSVSLCRSMDLPDVSYPVNDKDPNGPTTDIFGKRAQIREGIIKRVLDAPDGVRLAWLRQWADEVYRLSTIRRGPGILDGSEFLNDDSAGVAEPSEDAHTVPAQREPAVLVRGK